MPIPGFQKHREQVVEESGQNKTLIIRSVSRSVGQFSQSVSVGSSSGSNPEDERGAIIIMTTKEVTDPMAGLTDRPNDRRVLACRVMLTHGEYQVFLV